MAELALVETTDAPAPPPPQEFKTRYPDRPYFSTVPFDRFTGLPHLIAPPETIPNPASGNVSKHHRQSGEEFLKMIGDIGVAIRGSMIQWTFNCDHNLGPYSFHAMTGRAYIPPSKNRRMALIVLNSVHAVTDYVFDPRLADVRRIKDDERNRLFVSGEIGVESKGALAAVRRAITGFAVEKGLRTINPEQLAKFKDASDVRDRTGIANDLIGSWLPGAYMAVDERYQSARSRGFLPKGAPTSAAEVARQYVFSEQNILNIFYEGLKVVDADFAEEALAEAA